jgi:hypothetical protein
MLSGGEAGIRTLGTRKGTTVFETAPIDRSGTSPDVHKRMVVWEASPTRERPLHASLGSAARAEMWASRALSPPWTSSRDTLIALRKPLPGASRSGSEWIRLEKQWRPTHLLIVFIVAAHQSR